jgi:hypothetical protein
MGGIGQVHEALNRIGEAWKNEHLATATGSQGVDFDAYAKPIIIVAESLRQNQMRSTTRRIYEVAIRLVDQHCANQGIDLHRGALYANYGISLLEQDQFELGISWLLAAAKEDVRFGRIADIHGSYAWSQAGIYGQWVDVAIFKKLPPNAIPFVATRLATNIGLPDVMAMLRSLAGNGDLNLLRGIVEYEYVRGRTDFIGHSVRFTCLRDLATLFEVLLKQIGEKHGDPQVRAAFGNSPMLGNIIHHMHHRAGAAYSPGLFWNAVRQDTNVVDGIANGFDFVKDFTNHSINDVWTYLQSHVLLNAARAQDEEVAKRMLLSYRLRNQTSHSFKPEDPGIVAHADELQLWLLQAIFYAYFWFTRTGQVTL